MESILKIYNAWFHSILPFLSLCCSDFSFSFFFPLLNLFALMPGLSCFFFFFEFLNFILFIFLCSRFLLVIHFIHISVYMSIPITQFITPPPPPPRPRGFPPLVSTHLFSTSVSQFLPCKPVHLYHFPKFHIYALI